MASNFRTRSAIFLDELIKKAIRFNCAKGPQEVIRYSLEEDMPIPDQYKPGYIILNLDKEKKEILLDLTSDDVKNIRTDAIRGY